MELDVMLCDFAQVADNKLFINGANIDRVGVQAGTPPPYVLNFAAAGIVTVPWNATNAEHALNFRFVTQDGQIPKLAEGLEVGPDGISGEMRFNIGRPPQLTSGEDQMVPFAFVLLGLPVASPGRHVMTFALDGTDVRSLPFTIAVQPSMRGFGPGAIPPLG